MSTNPSASYAVVFDFGNVLVRWDLAGALMPPYTAAEVEEFVAATDFYAFNHLQDAGRPWDEALEWLAEHHPQWVEHGRAYVDNFERSVLGEVEGSAEVVRELLDAGVPCYGLTNWSAEYHHLASVGAPIIDELADVIVSGVEKVAKPDPRIFDIATERIGYDPAHIVFFDDVEANVAAARSRGWQAFVFTDAAQMRADLASLGLPVASPDAARA